MVRKKREESGSKVIFDWDPDSKEPWLLEFEKQPVNDERWTCLVTSAIPAKAEDDECIEIYKQSVALGLRRAIKILSMSDVVNLLKESGDSKDSKGRNKKAKGEKPDRAEEKPPSPCFSQILSLVLKYAKLNEFECKLPPDLMAVLLKYMILKMKEENIRERKIRAVRERKIRERRLLAKFIRDLKPYEIRTQTENDPLRSEEYINDEPLFGPDLYIMLTNFFDAFYYPELQRINVPFVAFLKVMYMQDVMQMKRFSSSILEKPDVDSNNEVAINEFWENLKENCMTLEKTSSFKDMVLMKYTPTFLLRQEDPKRKINKLIFDEMSWIQYAAYHIYCHHQKYLRQLYVQKVILSLEPLDLTKCEVYNKLCDALITGQPLSPLFILYAMIEQLVVGIPETECTTTELDGKTTDFFPYRSRSITEGSGSSKQSTVNLITPCVQCRDKANDYANVCEILFDDGRSTEKSEWTDYSEDKAGKESNHVSTSSTTESNQSNKSDCLEESKISVALIDRVLGERKTEKEMKKDKKWKTPKLCFYGDSVTLQTYHCDPRIIDPEELILRFMKNADLMKIWTKYPKLPPEERAFYNFHYRTLLKISQEKEELFKIKILFTLLMKITGVSKFYLFRGDEDSSNITLSDGWKSKQKILSNDKLQTTLLQPDPYSFSNYFFGSFILDLYKHAEKKAVSQFDGSNEYMNNLWSIRADSKIYLSGNRSSVTYSPHNFMYLESLMQDNSFNRIKEILLPILECLEISRLSDFDFVKQFDGFWRLLEGFGYYERLKPALMIQRLLEHREDYNTIHCTYFPPTDNVAILMHNDSDHRGIFYRRHFGKLPTPIALRDFYNYVYPEISDWIVEETAASVKFVSKHLEKEKAAEEKKDEEFLAKLKLHYCRLNKTNRKEFLEQQIDVTSEPEVAENELSDLPYKIKPENSSGGSFVVSNLGNLRVEAAQKVHEFHSKDGTEVHVVFDSWLYDPSELLILSIRRGTLWLRFCKCYPEEEVNCTFTLKTSSDIIFVFFQELGSVTGEPTRLNVRISWPTGLLIEVKSTKDSPDSIRYIKQAYIQACRKGWEIEEEKSRCYLKNGEIIIFKDTGEIEILTGNGTIHNLYYGERSRFETITMTGEVWEQRMGKTCRGKRRKISSLKIYIGVDCKTQETYYKRDDGTSCMLWPSGKLVTIYPDGTKITSTPDFDEDEVRVEWSEEEKQRLLELESKPVEESGQKSQTTISIHSGSASQRSTQSVEFVSVSCTYLMEHPKYSTVFCETNSSFIEIRMLENLGIKAYSGGCYEVQKENKYLIVGDVVQFNTRCDGCEKSSTAVIDFNSNILCHCVDLFENEFILYKNGDVVFQENTVPSEELAEGCGEPEKKNAVPSCFKEHAENIARKQRCFILERDLSGVEFIHEDTMARHCHDLQDDTYFDLNTDNPNSISHTFSSSLYKVGHENWVMHYEKDDSLPTNLKKKDLKDLEVKENRRKLFKYPFPRSYDIGKFQNNNRPRQKIKMPKVKLVRTIKCLPVPGPHQVVSDICKYVALYRNRAHAICREYEKHRVVDDSNDDATSVKMRLKKIAVTLSQSLTLYPHVCTQLPSTEKDIHYFGHLINTMEDLKSHFNGKPDLLPDCKQIPRRLPHVRDFPTIHESES